MTLYEMTKQYGAGKGESMMWDTLALVSDAMEASMPREEREELKRKLYGKLSGGHYNEQYAMEDVAKMSYRDTRTGMTKSAPYWPVPVVRDIYESLKGELRGYNCWDFFVTLNMVATKDSSLVDKWFPNISDNDRDGKLVEMAVNWLHDENNPYGDRKIWCYLNG